MLGFDALTSKIMLQSDEGQANFDQQMSEIDLSETKILWLISVSQV